MVVDDPIQAELMLNRFRRLLGELQSGKTQRNQFEPWEIDILLDLESCQVSRRQWIATLRQYEKAVERQVEGGNGPPMKLSEFLALRSGKSAGGA